MTLQTEILALSAAYALLGILALIGVTRTRWPWPFKTAAIVLTSGFYILVFFRMEGLLGWSAIAPLPEHFQLLWARNVDPNLASNDPGAIHLWLEALDDANLPSGEPRAYRLPYSQRLADKVEAARNEIQAGHPQGGRAVDFGVEDNQAGVPDGPVGPPGHRAEAGGDPAAGGSLDPAFLGGDSKSVEFAPLPKPLLPPKDAP
jgi:hypothetical protein